MNQPGSIVEAIRGEGGRVTFARFMEMALTHPTLGYYSRADRLLWHGGDFSTAPAISPFFNKTLARLVTELLDASLASQPGPVAERGETEAPATGASRTHGPGVAARAGPGGPPRAAEGLGDADRAGAAEAPGVGARAAIMEQAGRAQAPGVALRPSVVELGGGEAQLAEAVLRYWESERPELRGKVAYRIVEVGARLWQRQARALEDLAGAGWDIGWGTDLNQACIGTRPVVIVGNEFLDTLPVHLVSVDAAGLREAYVTATSAGLEQTWGELSPVAAAEVLFLFGTLDSQRLKAFTADGILEVSPRLGDLVNRVAGVMPTGSLANADYGEWFPGLPQLGECWGLEGRRQRRHTVRGYFKHQMVLDPLARAGRQDLTADVDFAALDLHGRKQGFETVLFTTLARFLRGGGAESELQALRAAGTAAAGLDGAQKLAPATDVAAGAMAGADALEADRQATVLQNLLNEQDLGGAFKMMVQVRE